MKEFFTWQALVMFALGVILATYVKSLVGSAKSKLGG